MTHEIWSIPKCTSMIVIDSHSTPSQCKGIHCMFRHPFHATGLDLCAHKLFHFPFREQVKTTHICAYGEMFDLRKIWDSWGMLDWRDLWVQTEYRFVKALAPCSGATCCFPNPFLSHGCNRCQGGLRYVRIVVIETIFPMACNGRRFQGLPVCLRSEPR